MAALDFGMALARGMLPTSEKAQKDLLDLAGGRNIFKSEDWWNQQVDKQISEGYRVEESKTLYYTRPSIFGIGGGWQGSRQTQYGTMAPPPGAVRTGGFPYSQTQYQTKSVDLGFTGKREDYTAGELSDIEKSAKAGAARARRQTEQSKTSQKRLRRGTGGLAAKARPVGSEVTTGLPALGVGGLGLGATTLGKGLLV